MTTEQLSRSAFSSIWSALHLPNEPNHCGNTILELFKANAMSSFQKGLFDDLSMNKNFSNAGVTIVEMENLLIGNSNLMNQVDAALQVGINDAKIDMPPVETQYYESDYQEQTTNDDGGGNSDIIWGLVWLFGGLLVTAVTEGQTIFYGAMIYGVIKIFQGIVR